MIASTQRTDIEKATNGFLSRWPIGVVAVFFLMGGLAHFAAPETFTRAMPAYLPFHTELVYLSGAVELFGALLILLPVTRYMGAILLILLCIAVFPANLHMALNAGQFSSIPEWLLYLRLPLQAAIILFIWFAVKQERSQRVSAGTDGDNRDTRSLTVVIN